jgi:hypothetical protein
MASAPFTIATLTVTHVVVTVGDRGRAVGRLEDVRPAVRVAEFDPGL